MKKYIYIALLLLSISVTVFAQKNVAVKIDKIVTEGKTFIKVEIKNNNPSTIVINNQVEWLEGASKYLQTPVSYVRLIGNPTSQKFQTEPMVFKESIASDGKCKSRQRPIALKNKEIYIGYYQLFGGVFPQASFLRNKVYLIETLQLELTLSYYYDGDSKSYANSFLSNTITL